MDHYLYQKYLYLSLIGEKPEKLTNGQWHYWMERLWHRYGYT